MFKHLPKIILLLIPIFCTLNCATAYKYLGIFHTGGRSHHILGSALMKALARKGHEVTVISPFPLEKPIENYHDIKLKAMNSTMKNANAIETIMMLHSRGADLANKALNDPNVKAFLQSNQTFDAVICEVHVSDLLYGFSEHFNAPLIGLGPFGGHIWNADMVGSPSPSSYVPNAFLPFTDHMSLTNRVVNLAVNIFERITHDYFYMPRQEALYRQHFPNNKRSLQEVRKNAALVLLNQHVSLSFPRPYMPNHIEVGGMHINRKRTPLPEDIRKFIEEAKDGVIYFSMGSNLKSRDIPDKQREIILNTFRGLKQRVLWKFEKPNLAGKPDNVFISDWFPQDDILAHDNVLAFITHGGLLSTTETVYHGKPIIGMPIFGDQFLNMARAEINGYGIKLDFKELTMASFKTAIDSILTDPKYTQKVQQMSARYRDQLEEPLDRAIFWVEHVVRHKGAKYLHSTGLDMNGWQYHNIDAIMIIGVGVLLVLLLLASFAQFLLPAVLRALRGSGKKVKSH